MILIASISIFVALWGPLVNAATPLVLPTVVCYYNSTHFCHDSGCTALPTCWQADCDYKPGFIIVATICTAGPDRQYSAEEMDKLIGEHCYPSEPGELLGDQCCGGYPICAHDGENRDNFNIDHYLDKMFSWYKRDLKYQYFIKP